MAIITLFSADYCGEDEVINELTNRTKFRHTPSRQIISEAAMLAGMEEAKVERALNLKTSVFEKFTHEKQYALAHIKLVLSKMLLVAAGRDLILTGYSSQLIPREITHFFRIGLIADMQYRIASALEQGIGSSKEAEKGIKKLDEERAQWLARYCHIKKAFNSADYDLIIPMNKESVQDAADLIISYLNKDIFQASSASRQAVEDFNLQAMVEVALAKKGHDVTVAAINSKVNIIINKNVSRLNRLKAELQSIVEQVDGVTELEIGLSKEFHQADVYRKHDFEMPSKVLLVDDEQDFVKTLSERLTLRDMGTAVVHDGSSAINLIEQDQPDVMVLDLKMPGVDGFEVLKRVKESTPHVEVIILTGHGNEDDKKQCMDMGAFAYLRKPVNITKLSEVIKEANAKATKPSQAKKFTKLMDKASN
ncbi:MAG: response regulator [Desulfobulbaceae bacterium]|nr:response regulator [Desulfobulbaceae bacterium]